MKMNKLLWLIPVLLMTGCSSTQWEDKARAECADKDFGDVCRKATCGDDFNGYLPRGVCVATDIGKACLPYGSESPRRIYCSADKDKNPIEVCQLYLPTSQAVCKKK